MDQLHHLSLLGNIPGAFHSLYPSPHNWALLDEHLFNVCCLGKVDGQTKSVVPLVKQNHLTRPSFFFFAHYSSYDAQLSCNTSWWLYCGSSCQPPINYISGRVWLLPSGTAHRLCSGNKKIHQALFYSVERILFTFILIITLAKLCGLSYLAWGIPFYPVGQQNISSPALVNTGMCLKCDVCITSVWKSMVRLI